MALTMGNAELLKAILGYESISVPKTLGDALELVVDDSPRHVITGGFKEGWSSDMDAAVLASIVGAQKVIKLSNIEALYSADPRTDSNAVQIKEITWDQYFRQFGITPGRAHHAPGVSIPVGAHSATFSKQKGITFHLTGGKLISESETLDQVFEAGSLIHP